MRKGTGGREGMKEQQVRKTKQIVEVTGEG